MKIKIKKNRVINIGLIISFWGSSFVSLPAVAGNETGNATKPVIKTGLSTNKIIDKTSDNDIKKPDTPVANQGGIVLSDPKNTASSINDENAYIDNSSSNSQDLQVIKNIIVNLEDDWNNHDLEKVMNYYSDTYINNDGLDKTAITELTKDFWTTYPDVKSNSRIYEIRMDGDYATVESLDKAFGHTAKEMPGLGTKGVLSSKSEGALYIKRTGKIWKIIGDRNNFEEVKVSFGIAKLIDTSFSAPAQVKSGSPFSAKLNMESLPPNIGAIGSITNEPLKYPQSPPNDCWRPIIGSRLERIMTANTDNRNELLIATIGLTDPSKGNLAGLEFITRRLNVVPEVRSDDIVKLKNKEDAKKSPIDGTLLPGNIDNIPGTKKDDKSVKDKDNGASNDKKDDKSVKYKDNGASNDKKDDKSVKDKDNGGSNDKKDDRSVKDKDDNDKKDDKSVKDKDNSSSNDNKAK